MILCGGPDWPTSVLTGILRLSCVKMLIGSLPVVLIIIPSTALGACLAMSNRQGWEIVSKLVTLVAGGSQLGVSVGFAAVIERAASMHANAIASLPYDDEVLALESQQRSRERAWRTASDWNRDGYPRSARVVLTTAALLGVTGCHLPLFVRCFERVTVADSFTGPPLHGNPLNVVRGVQGWTVICCFALASALLYGHRKWLNEQASLILPIDDVAGNAPEMQEQALPAQGAAEEDAKDVAEERVVEEDVAEGLVHGVAGIPERPMPTAAAGSSNSYYAPNPGVSTHTAAEGGRL